MVNHPIYNASAKGVISSGACHLNLRIGRIYSILYLILKNVLGGDFQNALNPVKKHGSFIKIIASHKSFWPLVKAGSPKNITE